MRIEEIFRAEHGRILATLIRVLGDFDVAEEALQEAFEVALEQWPAAGMPDNPVAWLIGTARHKAIDRLRRRARLAQKQDEIARHLELLAEEEEAPVPEDRLRLIFTCCHPALATEAQVALTLRTLGGLSTEEIARAFLVPASTMAQRIVRAKAKIRAARILALARTIRCAMVDAGTRKARAISSVERPPSVRRVRATCASVASAGWQHVKISRSLSSGTGASSSSAKSSRCRAISSCFCARRARRRSRSIALWRAVPISQATGLSGMPAAGHCSSATSNASCSASSATSKSPSTRISVARIRPCSTRKISSMCMAAPGRKATPPGGRLLHEPG